MILQRKEEHWFLHVAKRLHNATKGALVAPSSSLHLPHVIVAHHVDIMPHTQRCLECAAFQMAKSYSALIAFLDFLLLQISIEKSASISSLAPYA
jgi:hypothetical protein